MLSLGIALITAAVSGGEPRFVLHYPDHADGRVVFVSQNDLWIAPEAGGVAWRVTALPGVESHPKFSPDGRQIAFDAQFHGGTAIYVMPSQGGEPRRLTFHPDDSTVVDWSPDGRRVLFTSGRLTPFRGGLTRLFEVSVEGGPPEVLPTDLGSAASYSPDGAALAFTRHSLRSWWRKGYTGTQADTLWRLDRRTGAITALTEGRGQDRWPMWAADGRIYFCSEREGVANLYALDPATKQVQRLTDHPNRGVEWPSLGQGGKTIVYSRDGRLWLLDLASSRSVELRIEVPGAPARPLVEWVNPFKDYFKAAKPSPSGRLVAIEARGEIFVVPVRTGDTRNLTHSPGARDSEPSWSPDGRHIACISDGSGEFEVLLLDPQGVAPARQLTESGGLKRGLVWSGDSKRLLFETNEHALTLLDVETRRLTPVARSPIGAISHYAFSPDGAWITYVLPQPGGAYDILWLHSLAQGKAFAVTSGEAFESSPVFDPAGRFLYFLSSGRALVWAPNAMAPAPRNQTAVMAVTLRAEDGDPFAAVEDREPVTEAPKDPLPAASRISAAGVVVETNGLPGRVRRLPVPPGEYRRLTATEKRLFFLSEGSSGKPKLMAWDLTSRETVDVADAVTGYELAARGDRILINVDAKLQTFAASERPKPGDGFVDTSNLVMRVDRRAEWRQMFEEFVRVMREQFYVENFHGRDWTAVAAHYRDQLSGLVTREELTELLLSMVGELNASHQGAGGGDIEKVPPVSAGLLGAELSPDIASGRYRFAKIYRGGAADPHWRAPLDDTEVRIREGDYLLRIAGQEVHTDQDYLVHLMGLKGRVRLTTSRSASGDPVDTSVELVGSREAADLRHLDWIRRTEARVASRGGGRIGYVRLTDMLQLGMTEFMRGIVENRMKDGLILDCRNNSGGSIEKDIIDLLERRPWMMIRQDRYVEPMWRPADAFFGHVALLVNEYSVSDAELFPIGFKTRNLGTLVGIPGSGANLGAPNYELVDGGFVRLGIIGLWGADGQQFEGFAQEPDVFVVNLPGDVVRGRDAQLEAAIDTLLARISREPVKRPSDVKIEKKTFR
jgi:tricorn protease